MIENGHISINTKMSQLLSHSALSRQGHLEVVLHIMGYLKLRHNSRLVLDISYPNIDHSIEEISMRVQWKLFHPILHNHGRKK